MPRILFALVVCFSQCWVNARLLSIHTPRSFSSSRIVNQTDVTFDMDTYPSENSAPMIDSDLMVVNWEDILYRRPGYCGGDLHDMMDTDRFDVWKQMDYAHSRPDGGETRGVRITNK